MPLRTLYGVGRVFGAGRFLCNMASVSSSLQIELLCPCCSYSACSTSCTNQVSFSLSGYKRYQLFELHKLMMMRTDRTTQCFLSSN